jgi:hypothetical protein
MVGDHKTAGIVERDFGKAVELRRAQVPVEVFPRLNRQIFLAIDLRGKIVAARQAKTRQAVPAFVFGEAEGAGAEARFADHLAELGRQHEPALFAAKRKSLATVADCLPRLHVPRPCPLGKPHSPAKTSLARPRARSRLTRSRVGLENRFR